METNLDYNNFELHELAQMLEDTSTKHRLARILAHALLNKKIDETDMEGFPYAI